MRRDFPRVETLYSVLGVSRRARPDEIRTAYRELARHHPDARTGEPDAARFRQVQDAYAVLSDPERRRTYDAWLDADAAACTRPLSGSPQALAASRARVDATRRPQRRKSRGLGAGWIYFLHGLGWSLAISTVASSWLGLDNVLLTLVFLWFEVSPLMGFAVFLLSVASGKLHLALR